MSTIGEDILTALTAALQLDVATLAKVVAVWDTARQAIRTEATGIAAAAVQGALNEANANYLNVPLSPAVLADMSIRNLTIPADASGIDAGLVAEAAFSGIDPARFAALSLDTGESYGVIDALRLWHQGTFLVAPVANPDTSVGASAYISGASLGTTYGIGETELDNVVYYSRIRNEFLPDLKQLSWSTMSTADAVETYVKGKADRALALSWFEAAGGMPEQFDVLYDSAGDAIGVEKAVELWQHGNITEEEVDMVLGQSRTNPNFYAVAKLTNTKWLPAYEIRQAVAAGDIDVATATTWMMENGYPADQAAAFVSAASGGTTKTAKAETEGQILSDYEAQIISETDATNALANLGYIADAIPFILDTVVSRRVLSMRNAAITRLRTSYIDYLLSEADTRTALNALGLPTAAIDQFLTFWTIEQQTNVKRLSAAQVGHLVEYGYLDANNAVTRWVQMGYLPEEAELLLFVYVPNSKASQGSPPPVTTVPPSDTATTPSPVSSAPPTAEITQSAPTTNTTTAAASAAFTDQLAVELANGAVTWSENQPVLGLSVSPSGQVSTTQVLTPGTYSLTGTMVDANGDSGSWSYALTVTA